MNYSALPETLPITFALEPVGLAIVFPQELHVTGVVAWE